MINFIKKYLKKKIIGLIIPPPFYPDNIEKHKTAKVSATVVIQIYNNKDKIIIGRNSCIRHFSVIRTYGGFLSIGTNTSINPFAAISCQGGVTIGNNVRIADHVAIHAAQHVFESFDAPISDQGTIGKGIIIEDDVWIGAGVIILDDVTIGRGSVIAAGAVVTKSCNPGSVICGVPARLMKMRNSF